MASKRIDFGKCKDFDELCGLLNMLDIFFNYTEGDPEAEEKLVAFEPYFADEEKT